MSEHKSHLDASSLQQRSVPSGPVVRAEPARQAGLFLLLLLATDLVFVGVHLVHTLSPFLGDRMYSLETDRGYAECFQYVQMFWIVLMLGALWWRTHERLYSAWMLLYSYLLCDDAFQLHEHLGYALARSLGLTGAFGLRAQDLGELALSGAVGGTLLVALVLLCRYAAPDARNACKDLALLLGVLVCFGVGVDMLHVMSGSESVAVALGVVEDGGELIAMSATCAYALRLTEQGGRVPVSLWRRWSALLGMGRAAQVQTRR